jgi:hypothetical protein
MNLLLKQSLASVSLFKSSHQLCFRSLKSPYSCLRMSSTLSLEELRAKSTQASELIEKLKRQIEQIKLASTPASMAERAKSLQQENETLKKRVDELKKELEEAEGKSKLNNAIFKNGRKNSTK